MRSSNIPPKALLLVRLACFCLFFGRGWQFLFHPSQLDFWLENQVIIQSIGVLFFLGSAMVLYPKLSYRKQTGYLLVLALPLLLMSLASWQANSFMLSQLIEMTAQWATPVILFLFLKKGQSKGILLELLIITALVFTGHGLFAADIFPRPPHFDAMTQSILGVDQSVAASFLLIAGILDLVVSGGIFYKPISRYLLIYAAIWGFLTALARPMAYIQAESFFNDLSTWLPAMVYRIPHSFLPLAAFFLIKEMNQSISEKKKAKETVFN